MSYLVYIKQAVANLFKPPVTSEYPLAPKTFCQGVRGRVVNDVSQCILCGMCERSCPSGALTVDRKTGEWRIDPFSCIQCGACVEACPKKCLSMDPHYAMPGLEKTEIILTAVKKEGVSEVKKTVAAQNTAMLAMDDRSHIVNNVLKCVFCGMCERNCPAGAITVDRANRTWRIDLEACVNCGTCIDNCPRKCLSLGCYLGNRTEITVRGVSKLRRRPAEPVMEEAQPPAAAQAAVADNHVKNEIEKCLFCGKCEKTCPVDAITIDRRNRTWTIDRNKCITCGACALDCPAKCLSLADTWGEGENKAAVSTYQGKVLTRRPRVRPAPPAPQAEPLKTAPAPEPVKDVPQSENPHHVKNDIEKCLFCGRCEHSCPMQAITIDRKTRKWTIDREKCVACGVCAENCPAKCLAMKEEWEEGEDKALVLTLTGKAPVRPARPAAKPAEMAKPAAEPPKAEPAKAVPAPEPAKDVPQSENPHHVKNTIEKCLFCGRCEHSCPMQAITIDRKTRKWTIDREKCVACGVCAENCPAKCLAMKEEWEEGEDKALVLTLTGKAPVRPARPAAKPVEAAKPAAEPPKAEAPKEVPASEPAKDVPQSENPHHVKNDIEKCLFCGRCEHSCPMQAITIDRKTRKWTIDREKCVACGVCAENCPAKCLAMKEEWEEGEDKALVLTLTGKAPVRPARPRPPVKKDEPHA